MLRLPFVFRFLAGHPTSRHSSSSCYRETIELVSGRRIEDAYSICGFSIHEYIGYGDEEGSKLRCKAAKLFATYVYSEMIR